MRHVSSALLRFTIACNVCHAIQSIGILTFCKPVSFNHVALAFPLFWMCDHHCNIKWIRPESHRPTDMSVTSWQPPVARGKRVFPKVSKNILVIALVWLTLCFKPSLNESDGLKKKGDQLLSELQWNCKQELEIETLFLQSKSWGFSYMLATAQVLHWRQSFSISALFLHILLSFS